MRNGGKQRRRLRGIGQDRDRRGGDSPATLIQCRPQPALSLRNAGGANGNAANSTLFKQGFEQGFGSDLQPPGKKDAPMGNGETGQA